MRNNDIPVRHPDFVLERIDNDYQLRHRSRNTAIYINETAALLWELCSGQNKVSDMKRILRDAYPDAAGHIDNDVDESISVLAQHEALTCG